MATRSQPIPARIRGSFAISWDEDNGRAGGEVEEIGPGRGLRDLQPARAVVP